MDTAGNDSMRTELARRLRAIDMADIDRSLRLSEGALKARLDGRARFDASQLLVAASLAGLRVGDLLEFALHGVH